MGLFTTSKPKQAIPWIRLENLGDLNKWIEESYSKPTLFFKHSTRCGTSIMTLNSFESGWSRDFNDVNLVFIDLLKHRDISNEITSVFNVRHESPQAILVKDGKVVYHASHSEISARRIEKLV